MYQISPSDITHLSTCYFRILALSDKFRHILPFTEITHINLIWRVNFCKSMISPLKENNGIVCLGCLLHHTSMFETPPVNRFSLASVDVI